MVAMEDALETRQSNNKSVVLHREMKRKKEELKKGWQFGMKFSSTCPYPRSLGESKLTSLTWRVSCMLGTGWELLRRLPMMLLL